MVFYYTFRWRSAWDTVFSGFWHGSIIQRPCSFSFSTFFWECSGAAFRRECTGCWCFSKGMFLESIQTPYHQEEGDGDDAQMLPRVLNLMFFHHDLDENYERSSTGMAKDGRSAAEQKQKSTPCEGVRRNSKSADGGIRSSA